MADFATAEDAYNKDKKIRKEDVQSLQDWIKKQPHLPEISEFQVILFLHSNYYRIESAKTCIDKYYTVRAQCPEIFADRNTTAIKSMMNISTAILLPEPTPKGYSVLFAKLMETSSDNFNNTELVKFFDMVVALVLAQLGTVEGHVLVVDMEGVSLGHITKVNLNITRKYMYYLQEALPIRAKEIHVINVTSLAQRMLNLVKSFINKDILDSLHFHTTVDGLFEFIPKSALPSEYGGNAGSLKELQATVNKNLADHADFFKADEKSIADETKRVGGKSKYLDEEPEMAGSFKKLDIF